jgi:hypothetical protein
MGERRRFADAVDACFARGVKNGRKAGDWKHIKPTEQNYALYQEKVRSHLTRFDITGDPSHLAAVACNAEILWEMAMREHYNNLFVGSVRGEFIYSCDGCGGPSKNLFWTTKGYMCEACSEH